LIDLLERGRDASRRHAWTEVIEAFTTADGDVGLAADDLRALGHAQWWSGHPDDATDAFERAFAGYVEAGRPAEAAEVAMELAYRALRGLKESVGGGWLGQAARLLEEIPESSSHAWLAVFGAFITIIETRYDEGLEQLDSALAMARRTNNPSALYLGISIKGYALTLMGRWQEGITLIDEAAAAAAGGQLDLRVASDIFCTTIAACRDSGDLERAGQWADEGERWMKRNGSGGYPGVCRVHRAELKMLRGDWEGAEVEARQACRELEQYRLSDAVGYGQYAIGEIRLRMGDLDGAAAAFDRAYELGHPAQPGLALLQLARGEIANAGKSIARAVAATAGASGPADRLTRARLLPAQVDIALAAGDLETTRLAVEELETIATDYGRPLFRAGAMTARGELLLGEEKAAEATPILGQSWRLWQTTDLPYESARARLHYAEALAADGDPTTARRDILAARSTFERLGAALDLQRVEALLAGDGAGASGAEAASGPAHAAIRVTRAFMFTDIVTSTDLLGVMGDEAWTEVLAWHDRELRAAFAAHRGDEVSHTGDGFFVAFEHASDGIACAVDIQRRLARHRREHGFAPWVRIGLHTAEATRRGRNFAGQGVHVAARVGAVAGREEILVSSATADAAAPVAFPLSAARAVELKGVREPVEVRTVDWR
jgi:class 3 adenylate cyclase